VLSGVLLGSPLVATVIKKKNIYIPYLGFETIPTEQRVPFHGRYGLDLNSVMLMEKQTGSTAGP